MLRTPPPFARAYIGPCTHGRAGEMRSTSSQLLGSVLCCVLLIITASSWLYCVTPRLPANQPASKPPPPPALCRRSDAGARECALALHREMQWAPPPCPAKCVTFAPYGRFNNNVRQVVNAVSEFSAAGAARRRSVVLPPSFQHAFGEHFDLAQLAQACVFVGWAPGVRQHYACEPVDWKRIFHKAGLLEHRHRTITAWLLLGTVSDTFQRQSAANVAALGPDYSGLHARFLEGECAKRHRQLGLAPSICDLQPGFVAAAFKAIGHVSQRMVVCTDHQRPAQVRAVLRTMNATLSHHTHPLWDFMLLVYAKHFVSNRVSTFSQNVLAVRRVVFGNATIGVLK